MTSTTITSGYVSLSSSTYLSDGTASVVYAAAASTPTLTNAGTIVSTGANYTVAFAGSGTITNTGLLAGTGEIFGGAGALFINSGTVLGPSHYAGGNLRFNAGGSVTNTSAGILDTNIYAPGSGAPVTVVNAGFMFTNGTPIALYAGGIVTNSGTIREQVGSPIVIRNGAASVANTGSIDGHAIGINASNNTATITNTGTGQISAFWGIYSSKRSTVTNSGTIVGGAGNTAPPTMGGGTLPGVGVYLGGGGLLTNGGNGTITGFDGVKSKTAPTTVYNYGSISGTNLGLDLGGPTTLTNGGSIAGGVLVSGVANIYNNPGATIDATSPNGLYLLAGAQVFNHGTIHSSGQNGVRILNGGQVANGTDGTIAGIAGGVVISDAIATVTNEGSITGTSQYGAFLLAGGTVSNQATAASIHGGKSAVYIKGGTGSVYNLGTLSGGTATGVYLKSGGNVVNAYAASYITGPTNAVEAAAGSYLYLRNDGTIISHGTAAIFTTGAGNIFNRGGAQIYGGVNGISVGPNSTVTNVGTIDAPNHAVELGNGSTLVLYPGSKLHNSLGGQGLAAVNGTGTIELLAGADPVLNHGSLFDVGNHYINFDHIIADPGASWTIGQLFNYPSITAGDGALTFPHNLAASVTLTSTGAGETITFPGNFRQSFSGAITGASFGDTFILPGANFADGDIATIVNGNTLAVYDTTNTQVFAFTNFTPAHGATPADFIVGPQSVQDIACFARGTRISTPTGPTPIENLEVGDLVLSAFGGTVPIQWIGHRTVDATKHPRRAAQRSGDQSDSGSASNRESAPLHPIWPIRIQAHALAHNTPSRDLYVSPEHALHFDGHLIPAHLLVNGTTITQVPRTSITYFHLELPQHDVILAENTECESYLDTNNRADFENTDGPITLHPTFTPDAQRSEATTQATASPLARESAPLHPTMTADELWRAQACAPQCRQGPTLETIRTRIATRATHLTRADLRASPEPQPLRA